MSGKIPTPPFESVDDFLKWARYFWELQELLCRNKGHGRTWHSVVKGSMDILICGPCFEEKNEIYRKHAEDLEEMLG